MDKVWVVWIEDQTNHYIPLSQSLNQSKENLTLFNATKIERGEETEEEKFEVSRGCSWGLRKEAVSIT